MRIITLCRSGFHALLHFILSPIGSLKQVVRHFRCLQLVYLAISSAHSCSLWSQVMMLDLPQFNFRPYIRLNTSRILEQFVITSIFLGKKISVLSANYRSFTLTFLLPISTALIRFRFSAFLKRLTNTSLTNMNEQGDRGHLAVQGFDSKLQHNQVNINKEKNKVMKQIISNGQQEASYIYI